MDELEARAGFKFIFVGALEKAEVTVVAVDGKRDCEVGLVEFAVGKFVDIEAVEAAE